MWGIFEIDTTMDVVVIDIMWGVIETRMLMFGGV
jgi:hypothetical protein